MGLKIGYVFCVILVRLIKLLVNKQWTLEKLTVIFVARLENLEKNFTHNLIADLDEKWQQKKWNTKMTFKTQHIKTIVDKYKEKKLYKKLLK